MSVPLDRLYNHLDGLCNHDALIYRFYPHGSKKLEDLQELYNYYEVDWFSCITRPNMVCHDQEPLNFGYYSKQQVINIVSPAPANALDKISKWFDHMNIRVVLSNRHSLYDLTMLTHSEKNSTNLEQYEQAGFVGIHWWAHAALARDWYRYAQYDPELRVNFAQITQDFLVYNRAWSGTREYRLKFTELVVDTGLHNKCLMKFSPECDGKYYQDFTASNSTLSITRHDLDQYFDPSTVDATASADYNNIDYQHTAIEVVLETLFDDSRLHLTEKSLRPIACGRPFILAATPGSLEYLKSYGFETFSRFIDESYDKITNPAERLVSICKEMQRIANLSQEQKRQLWQELYAIAQRNQQLFFSDAWQKTIFDEFVENYKRARKIVDQHVSTKHWKNIKEVNFDLCPHAKMLQNLKPSLDNQKQIQDWLDSH